MSYFTSFPLTTYTTNNTTVVVKDILRRCSFVSEYRPYTDLYYPHTIMDGETAQSLAVTYYKSVNYYWVITLFNEIHDLQTEWPLNQYELEQFCVNKYGIDEMYKIKHYTVDGLIVGYVKEFSAPWTVPEVVPGAVPVSFFEYETELNDAKRQIKILRLELLSEFVTQFERMINV